MAGTSLLTLIDDIATLLDDVAALSKVAVKKTAGVLGDDLAVNAEQVSGIASERELPVIFAVAKGSFKNKFILVPSALAISVFIPWLITPLLLLGGSFLCFEGFEKIIHWIFPSPEENKRKEELKENFHNPQANLKEFEAQKIKGAIRTDFILSAEVVVIALGTVANEPFKMQAIVVSIIAIGITFGVYGLVSAIVKIDDAGLYLVQKHRDGKAGKFAATIGNGLLAFAPKLMKTLTVVGTIAMFLVGGGIFSHGIPFLHHLIEGSTESVKSLPTFGHFFGEITPTLINMAIGLTVGALIVGLVKGIKKIKGQ